MTASIQGTGHGRASSACAEVGGTPASATRGSPDRRSPNRRARGGLRRWFSAPVIALLGSLLVFTVLGQIGLAPWDSWPIPLRWALATMFVLTASARFGPRAAQLRAMVPRRLPHPGVLVAVSGLLEALGAVGLVVPATAPAAGWCLVALLLALFPANVSAARSGGDGVTPLPVRTVQQALFVACAVLSAL